MTEYQHLAMAAVPIQSWGRVFDEIEALENGTIFPELNKPFFVTAAEASEKHHQMQGLEPREAMLLQIQRISFMLDDLRLYMDTHPDDKEGLDLLKTLSRERKELLSEFAVQFDPLTVDCMAETYEKNPESDCYSWQKGRIPWEGVCV